MQIRLWQLSLLQIASGPVLANCDRFFVCDTVYNKLRQVLIYGVISIIKNCDSTALPCWTISLSLAYDWRGVWTRLRVVPQFSSGIVERAKTPFLAWGDFHARLRFARSTIPEEKWGTTRSLYVWTGLTSWNQLMSCLQHRHHYLRSGRDCCFKPGHQRWPNIDQFWVTHTYAFPLSASVRPCWQCHQTNNNEAFWFPQLPPHKGLKNLINRWYS